MAINFNNIGTFAGTNGGPNVLSNPTSLQFGPDGRLYVSEQNGSINAFTLTIENGVYIATDHELLVDGAGNEVVKNIQNHNDDGSLSGQSNRQVTGLVVTEDDQGNVVLYISSSDPRISSNGEVNLDTNSGVITKVTQNGDSWDTVDIVRGLPRSEENHSTNGLALSPDGTKLYIQNGGNTNNGAPSSFFSYTAEYALSGALLELDLADIEQRSVQTDPAGGQGGIARDYVYDLPTLDDPNITNTDGGGGEDASGMDEAGPWGGNDGLNQAILPSDAPLRIYADGFRNQYDIVVASDGDLYTVDNGSNGNLGGYPNTDTTGEALNTPNNGGQGDPEPLFHIVEGGYYGHANPTRANQDQAWTVYNNNGTPDGSVGTNTVSDISALVPDGVAIEDGYLIDPSRFAAGPGQSLADLSESERAARLIESGTPVNRDGPDTNALATVGSSSNGVAEYDSGGQAFGGVLDGMLLVTQFNDNITLLNPNGDNTGMAPIIDDDGNVLSSNGVLQLGSFGLTGLGNPLDVTIGPNGTIWVAEIGSSEISVFAPSDLVLPDDPDFDNDGLFNEIDPFQRDATNGGSALVLPNQELFWSFAASGAGNDFPGPDGFGGGLTGVMIDGTTDFEQALQAPSDLPNQDVKLDNVKFNTAAGGGATVVEFVSNGDPFTDSDSGEYLFHTGATIAPTVETFTVTWSMFNPGEAFVGPFQQIGGYLGTGDQSNYLKIVALQHPSGEVQMVLEDGNAAPASNQQFLQADDLFDVAEIDAAKIFLSLTIDTVAETATPSITYETAGGGTTTVDGSALSIAGTTVLDVIKGDYSVQGQTTGLALGLFSSNTGQDPADTFQAVFDDIRVTATGDDTAQVLYRVNAGGEQVAAIDGGPDWAADTATTPNPYLSDAGSNSTTGFPQVEPGASVPATTPGAVFDTERWDDADGTEMAWSFDTPLAGLYEVRLFLGNGFTGTSAPGERVYDIAIEGEVLANLDDIDLSADFGHLTGAMISNIVTVTDGALDITFLHGTENPLINAIEIIQLGSAPLSVSVVNGPVNVSESDGQAQISLLTNQTVPLDETVTVAYEIIPGSATAALDYTVPDANFDPTTGIYSGTVDIAGGSSDVQIPVTLLSDTDVEGDETFTFSITGVSPNVSIGTGSATITIADDDAAPGQVLFRINSGGEEVASTDGGPSWSADTANAPTPFLVAGGPNVFTSTAAFTVDPSDVNGAPAAIFDTERWDPPADAEMQYEFSGLAAGQYTINLYMVEGSTAQSAPGERVFDVAVEGVVPTVFDDITPFDSYGNAAFVLSYTTSITDGTLDLDFLHGAVNNPAIRGIEILAAGSAAPSGGEAILAINNAPGQIDNIQISNFGNGSFVLTNTGTKDIASVTIDVSGALYPDSVFDPFGVAGDTTSKAMTISGGSGTGVTEPSGGYYLGAGGVLGYEGVQLDFNPNTNGGFNPGESVAFAVDMDPNSIAGAQKSILDPGADPAWDIGGISGAELIGSTFTITFTDGTTATGQLQGQTDPTGTAYQGGSQGIASQDSPGTEVSLSVNGLTPGESGSYSGGGPQVIVDGPAGTTVRVVLTMGFIQPGENLFPDTAAPGEYHDQLDAQLVALASSDFPANNAVDFQSVDVLLAGGPQDITSLFNFDAVVNGGPLGGGGWNNDVEGQLPLGLVVSAIDPANGNLPAGPVTAPIHLTYQEVIEADLSLDKTVSDPAPIIGDTVTFTLTVDNAGGSDATGVAVENLLPAGYTFLSASGDGSFDSQTGLWTIGAVGAGSSATLDIEVTVEALPTDDVVTLLIRVNAGGAEVAASDGGPAWSADQSAVSANGSAALGTPSPYLVDRGVADDDVTYGSNAPSGPGTNATGAPDDLFTTERYSALAEPDGLAYAFELDNGTYEVELFFDELFFDSEGARIFDVEIEGSLVLDDFDPFAAYGNDTGVESFRVVVEDGELNIDFLQGAANNPNIGAIQISSVETVVTGDYDSYAEIVASDIPDPDSTPGNGSTDEDDDVTVGVTPVTTADLELSKSVSDSTPAIGDTITFTLELAHVAGVAATGVAVRDVLPDGFSYVSDSGAGAYDPATGLWTIGDVDRDGTATLEITATVNGPVTPEAETVLYRVNAGGAEVAASDGGPAWSADTQGANSPYLVNAGSNNDFPENGSAKPGIDISGLAGTGVTAEVLGIERWDNSSDAAGEMAWAFDVEAGEAVRINLYLAEIFTGIPDADGSGDPTGDRVFDVSVDGVIPAVFDDIDRFALAGAFDTGAMLSFETVSDGTIDLTFLHTGVENTAVQGIEIIRLNDTTPVTPDYANRAEIVAADQADPDSTPDNGVAGEDDDASVTVEASAGGRNAATISAIVDGAEPGTDGQFLVSLEDAVAVDTTFTYAISGSATNGTDYTALTGTVTIAAGQSSVQIDIDVLDDDVFEGDETVEITLTGVTEGDDNIDIATPSASLDIVENEAPALSGGALQLVVTPGAGLDASTFSNGSFTLTNTSTDADIKITSVSIDLSTGILPDMVFDPTGSGGDATASPFTPNSGADSVGLVLPANPAADPFSQPRNGGFDVLSMSFTDFGQGKSFSFTTDVDPNSIQGVTGAGAAGAVSGYELIGATITVTFDNGTTTQTSVGSLFDESLVGGGGGSLGGALGTVTTTDAIAAPTLSLIDGSGDLVPSLPGLQTSVSGDNITVLVTGTPGATIKLLQMDSRLFIATGAPAFDVTATEQPFYANEAMAGKALFEGTIGIDGTLEIPATLLTTQGTGGTPEGGLNQFVAVQVVGGQTSVASTPLTVRKTPPVSLEFSYADDTFRNTSEPTYAEGEIDGDLLRVELGGGDRQTITDMSAGWSTTFETVAGQRATLAFDYRIAMAASLDIGETGEVLVSVDGQEYVIDVLAAGDDDDVGEDTGVLQASLDLGVLGAGLHTLTFGGYLNQKTRPDEIATIEFGNIDLSLSSANTGDDDGNLSVTTADVFLDANETGAVDFIVSGIDADAAAIVTISDGVTEVTGALSQDGTVTLDLSGLSLGAAAVSVMATDSDGNVAEVSGPGLTLVPATADDDGDLTLVAPDQSIDAGEIGSVSFTISGLDADATAEIRVSDGTETRTASVSADGTVTLDLSGLADGTAVSEIVATDVFGATTVVTGPDLEITTAAPPAPDFDFDDGPQGFVYADDTFRGTSQPGYATGEATDGVLRVELGGGDRQTITDMSAGWTTSFSTVAGQSAVIDFVYRITTASSLDIGEVGEVLVSVDGFEYVVDVLAAGDDDNVGEDTGFLQASLDLGVLGAGLHTLTLGGYLNQKTRPDEIATIEFDSLGFTLSTVSGADDDGNLAVTTADVFLDANETGAVDFIVSGIDADADALVTVSDGVTEVTGALSQDGTVTLDLSGLSLGAAAVSVMATDNDGNVAEVSGPGLTLVPATADDDGDLTLAAPDQSIDASEIGSVSFTISGLDADATAEVRVSDGTEIRTASVSADGMVTLDLTGLADGTAVSEIVAMDVFGATTVVTGPDLALFTQSAPPPASDFETGADEFVYADDTFRGTSQPGYATGEATDGVLRVELGGGDRQTITDMSAGWSTTFESDAGQTGLLDLTYRIEMASSLDIGEIGEVLVSVDGFEYVVDVLAAGDDDDVGENTGFIETQIDLGLLSAGQHTLTLGGFLNQKTRPDEIATIEFDAMELILLTDDLSL
ncbi:hypothetical protein OCH239_13095 [Roseivivax halodurans JCM 10272]|uniref:Calx-beta domain-containing protein n=1 Tax=Roseivivax halodurans JCM 10272 TaxID=1449350 RepID=X7EB29_9RHOB|nr:malectin domain-containing carbohydrate-binding protein [Roseivivax halodurans]ETX13162.1 hypothetical protein OCH239_13095 [Roseivivax halodurans JCM 10272]